MTEGINRLLAIMAQLRDPDSGCPWDLQQTFQSLARYTLEEAYETVDTIEQNRLDELPGELGDLLFQIVFYAQLGKEQQCFDFNTVVDAISSKLVSRHPHVFGEASIADAESQTIAWEQHKARERQQQGKQVYYLDGISQALPATTRALKLQKRAAQVGFDWPDKQGVIEKIREELDEVTQALARSDEDNTAEELGDLLFSCINLVRHCQMDPETVLRQCNHRFEQRFGRMETSLNKEEGLENTDLARMNEIWCQVKDKPT